MSQIILRGDWPHQNRSRSPRSPFLRIFLAILCIFLFSEVRAESHQYPGMYLDVTEAKNAFDVAHTHYQYITDELNKLRRGSEDYRRAIRCGNILIAEGDSWFNDPASTYWLASDIVNELEGLGWIVESSAHYGDTFESMLYDESQFSSIYKTLVALSEKALMTSNFSYPERSECMINDGHNRTEGQFPRNGFPKAILLSAGGNDIVHGALSTLLEHKNSRIPDAVSNQIKEGVFSRINRIVIQYFGAISAACDDLFDGNGEVCPNVPIIIHGLRLCSGFRNWI